MSIGAGVVVAVTFQQVDNAPAVSYTHLGAFCAVRRLHAPNAGLSGSHILPGGGHAQTCLLYTSRETVAIADFEIFEILSVNRKNAST